MRDQSIDKIFLAQTQYAYDVGDPEVPVHSVDHTLEACDLDVGDWQGERYSANGFFACGA